MNFLWDLIQQSQLHVVKSKADLAESTAKRTETKADRHQHQLRDLERQIERLNLVVIALCEVITNAGLTTREMLQATIDEIDLRDGTKDGRILVAPHSCPECSRPDHRSRAHCLYCGAAMEPDTLV